MSTVTAATWCVLLCAVGIVAWVWSMAVAYRRRVLAAPGDRWPRPSLDWRLHAGDVSVWLCLVAVCALFLPWFSASTGGFGISLTGWGLSFVSWAVVPPALIAFACAAIFPHDRHLGSYVVVQTAALCCTIIGAFAILVFEAAADLGGFAHVVLQLLRDAGYAKQAHMMALHASVGYGCALYALASAAVIVSGAVRYRRTTPDSALRTAMPDTTPGGSVVDTTTAIAQPGYDLPDLGPDEWPWDR